MIKKILFIILLAFLISCSAKVEKREEVKEIEPVIETPPAPQEKKEPEKIEKTFKESPANYPQLILPQEKAELEKSKLKIEKILSNDCQYTKRTLNNKEELYTPVFVEYDEFGYLDRGQCQQPVDKGKSSKAVEQVAREHFKTFEKYLGIEGVIEFDESRESYDTFIIRTKEQKYKDLPLVELKENRANKVKISIFLSRSDVVKDLMGHYYKGLKIPNQPQITLEQAKNNLIGTKHTFKDSYGDTVTKEVKIKDVKGNGELVVLVRKIEGPKIEYSLAWQIPVSGLDSFTAYIDALTGKTTAIIQKNQ